MIKNVFDSIKGFLIPYLVFLASGGFIYLLARKGDIVLFFNKLHFPALDFFFKYITHLGDGFFIVGVCIFMLFVKFRYAIVLFLSYALSGIFAVFLKNFVFADHKRPGFMFRELAIDYKKVDGVEIALLNSFPSGHTASAFALGITLSYILHTKINPLWFFGLAVIIGISRMYLTLHFLEDVLAGSFIGCLFSILVFIFDKRMLSSSPGLDKRIKI